MSRHPVSLALVFGSAARDEASTESGLDVAIAFESLRSDEDGYSDAFLRVRSELDDAMPVEVDLVDIRSVSPSFARVIVDSGELVLGSEDRRAEFERQFAGRRPSVTDARNRVAAAAERLRGPDSRSAEAVPE